MNSGRIQELLKENTTMRIGQGYDVHRLTEGRDLILGGVKIPYEKGLLGHSDADVLVHAVMDAPAGCGCTWRYRPAFSGYGTGVQGHFQHPAAEACRCAAGRKRDM